MGMAVKILIRPEDILYRFTIDQKICIDSRSKLYY